ncbi:MAG: hypothetical protein JJT81_17410 [Rubellimicrobium sp.]|nr:hypothetical protein [Rubellimicrobium sp.]
MTDTIFRSRVAAASILASGLVLGGSAALAQAGCPTADDLARGITIAFTGGAVETYRPGREPGVTEVIGSDGFGFDYGMRLAHGTHLLLYEELVRGRPDLETRQTYDYGMPVALMPVPEAGGRWAVDVRVTSAEGERTERQVQAYDTVTTEVIGNCSYDRIEAVIAYDTGDFYIEGIHFLPELQLGYLAWSESNGVREVDLSPVSISVAQ